MENVELKKGSHSHMTVPYPFHSSLYFSSSYTDMLILSLDLNLLHKESTKKHVCSISIAS